MKEQSIKAAYQALKEKLQEITKANGYKTDAGLDVRASYMAWVLAENPAPPFIVLQHGPTSTSSTSGNHKALLDYSPEILLAASATEQGLYDLMDMEADLRRCLNHPDFVQGLNGTAKKAEATGSQPAVLDDSSYALAVLPVTLTIIENYEA